MIVVRSLLIGFIIAVALIGQSMLGGCGGEKEVFHAYNDVERILMHEPNHYTFFFHTPEGTQVKQKEVWLNGCGRADIFRDVSTGERSWIKVEEPESFLTKKSGYCKSLEVHLSNINEVNGAGWYHGGKVHRSGQTTVLE